MIETYGTILLGFLTVYVAYRIVGGILGDVTDPSAGLAVRTDTGSFSFLLSGTWLVGIMVLLVAGLTWPMPADNLLFGSVLVAVVAMSFIIERREVN